SWGVFEVDSSPYGTILRSQGSSPLSAPAGETAETQDLHGGRQTPFSGFQEGRITTPWTKLLNVPAN
ncbi:MAG: hypothetical protein PVJ19_21535, partial [Desulfobacteraceae bacterium]